MALPRSKMSGRGHQRGYCPSSRRFGIVVEGCVFSGGVVTGRRPGGLFAGSPRVLDCKGVLSIPQGGWLLSSPLDKREAMTHQHHPEIIRRLKRADGHLQMII